MTKYNAIQLKLDALTYAHDRARKAMIDADWKGDVAAYEMAETIFEAIHAEIGATLDQIDE